MNPFEFYAPTKVVFGVGAVEKVGAEAKAWGATRILIIYGSERVVTSGLMKKVTDSLEASGIAWWKIGGVVPNPHLGLVYEALDLAKKEGVDFLLAIGGGSAIDTAKAVAYGLYEPEMDVWSLYHHDRTAKGCFPVASILTISAAGSETSNSSVITDERTGSKRSYNDDLARPKFAIMDPSLSATLPDYQTMSGCTDMMMHTQERYFTNSGNMEITDSIAEALLRTVIKNAQILHRDPQNLDARAEVMWSGSLAHNDLTGCGNLTGGDFVCHLMEHELGGMFDVTHGAGLAAIWSTWARYVYKNCLHRFVRYALNVMQVEPGDTDEETALRGIEAMEAFYKTIGMPIRIRELGIDPTPDQIKEMARSCAEACGGGKGAAKYLVEEDFAKIYTLAL